MNKTKFLPILLLSVFISSDTHAQFVVDSLPVSKNSISLNVTPILRLTGDHDDQGWLGLVYRRKLKEERGRIKVQFNQFEDSQLRSTTLFVYEDSTQVISAIWNMKDSYQLGFGYEYGKFHKRFHWYTGLEMMWMFEHGDFSNEPLYRYTSEYFITYPMPIGSVSNREIPIAEMDSSMFITRKWKQNYYGLGIPIGLSARISSHFEISAQWLVQFWYRTVQDEKTELFSGEVVKGEGSDFLMSTRSGELLLTYSF